HPCCILSFLGPPPLKSTNNRQKIRHTLSRNRLRSSLPPDQTRLRTRPWIQQPKNKQSRKNNSNNSKDQTSSLITTSSYSTHQSSITQIIVTATCQQQPTSPLRLSPPRQNLRASWMPHCRPISHLSKLPLPPDKHRAILTTAVVVIVTVMVIAASSCRKKEINKHVTTPSAR
ncbi:hypothetical protein BKA57DRAFT_24421, partial [Linnemannia elongata]